MAKSDRKKIVQDVIPPKRSIRNVELPSRARRLKVTEDDAGREIVEREEVSVAQEQIEIPERKKAGSRVSKNTTKEVLQYSYEYEEVKKPSRKGKFAAATILLVAVGFGVSAFFRSAEIRVTPKQESRTLDGVFSAQKNAATGQLGFQLVTVTKSVEKTAAATAEEKVDKKAQGQIVIYNNYSTESQKLVATTRFQTPEGLVFRILNDVVVPGKKTVSGKTVPGSIEVTVAADQPGADSNIGLKDFTIPGFKGDPRQALIYARSKTEMTGGFSGMQKVISKDILNASERDLEASLRQVLAKDITSQIPANFILYSNGISYSFEPAEQINGASGGAVLRKKGTANAVIFDKGDLSRSILLKISPELANTPLKINNLETLSFAYSASETDAKTMPGGASSIAFTLKGKPNIVWIFDENKLKSDLLGLSKKDGAAVIAAYPQIKEAWITTKPFWSQSIPSDSKKVTLINTVAQ